MARPSPTPWAITVTEHGVVVTASGVWFADADDIEHAVGLIQGARYRGDVQVTERDGYTYRRRV